MRFITTSITVLMSLLIIGFAILGLSSVSARDFRSIVAAIQILAEIAIGLVAISVAARACNGLSRQVTLVFLVPLALQRAWCLLLLRNEDLPWGYYLGFIVAPPFVLLLSLYFLPARHVVECDTERRTPPIILRIAIALLASVIFTFSTFNFCTGMDILGSGMPSIITSLFAIGCSISTLLYALNPLALYRRTATVNLVAIALALRASRAAKEHHHLVHIDESGWIVVLIDFVPLVAILVVGLSCPSLTREGDSKINKEPTPIDL